MNENKTKILLAVSCKLMGEIKNMSMKTLFIVLTSFFSFTAFGISAIDQAVLDAGILKTDSLETKIDKTLYLLNEKSYFAPKGSLDNSKAQEETPYHLDSLRTAEQILAQKRGGSCGSSALAFAAILNASGVETKDIQIVNSVVNKDLKIICPTAGKPRVQNPLSGAPGHVFVAIRFSNNKWKVINSIDGSKYYERAAWYSPEVVKKKIQTSALEIPRPAFTKLPKETYASGLTVFQTWSLDEVQLHTFEQRYDLIASGNLTQSPTICRFTSPQ